MQTLKRKLPDSSGIYCAYSIESDELVDLSQVSSKFVIHIADYNVSMFRAQRFFKGKYKDLDKKVIAYIASYLYGGNDDNEFNFQELVQNADVDVSLVNTATEEPEYADGNNCKVVKKNSRISKLVLVNSKYQCVADNTHTTFNTAKGVPYMEGHHLISGYFPQGMAAGGYAAIVHGWTSLCFGRYGYCQNTIRRKRP